MLGLSRDTLLHLTASACLALALHVLTVPLAVALLGAFLTGLLWEWARERCYAIAPEWSDVLADAAGVLAALLVILMGSLLGGLHG